MRDRGPVGDRRGVHLAHLEKADCTVSDIHESLRQQGLVRPLDGRVLGGVCAGLGRRFGLDPWPARLLFVLILMVIPGSQILIYPILWILMPSEVRAYPPYGAQRYQQYGGQPYPPNAAPYGPPTPPPVG
jgi:phage shock protein C